MWGQTFLKRARPPLQGQTLLYRANSLFETLLGLSFMEPGAHTIHKRLQISGLGSTTAVTLSLSSSDIWPLVHDIHARIQISGHKSTAVMTGLGTGNLQPLGDDT
jgi:hypothetical protein